MDNTDTLPLGNNVDNNDDNNAGTDGDTNHSNLCRTAAAMMTDAGRAACATTVYGLGPALLGPVAVAYVSASVVPIVALSTGMIGRDTALSGLVAGALIAAGIRGLEGVATDKGYGLCGAALGIAFDVTCVGIVSGTIARILARNIDGITAGYPLWSLYRLKPSEIYASGVLHGMTIGVAVCGSVAAAVMVAHHMGPCVRWAKQRVASVGRWIGSIRRAAPHPDEPNATAAMM